MTSIRVTLMAALLLASTAQAATMPSAGNGIPATLFADAGASTSNMMARLASEEADKGSAPAWMVNGELGGSQTVPTTDSLLPAVGSPAARQLALAQVSEPGTMAMLGIGFGVLGLILHRRRKRR
ncbi:MAG: PEP-CTERM sorting domain-containing protein [Massilia sp.]